MWCWAVWLADKLVCRPIVGLICCFVAWLVGRPYAMVTMSRDTENFLMAGESDCSVGTVWYDAAVESKRPVRPAVVRSGEESLEILGLAVEDCTHYAG